MQLEIFIRVEPKIIVESLLIVAMAALYFPVVPGCLWPDHLVVDVEPHAQQVKRMDTLRPGGMRKLSAVICLDCLRRVAKANDGTLHKVYGRITALFLVSIDKTLSGRFVDHGVLVELLSVSADITGTRDILHIHLPFDSKLPWRIIVTVVSGLLLGGFYFLAVAQADEHPV